MSLYKMKCPRISSVLTPARHRILRSLPKFPSFYPDSISRPLQSRLGHNHSYSTSSRLDLIPVTPHSNFVRGFSTSCSAAGASQTQSQVGTSSPASTLAEDSDPDAAEISNSSLSSTSSSASSSRLIHRLDYKPPAYWVRKVNLDVRLHLKDANSAENDYHTEVTSILDIERNLDAEAGVRESTSAESNSSQTVKSPSLILDGDRSLELLELKLSAPTQGSSNAIALQPEKHYRIFKPDHLSDSDPARKLEIFDHALESVHDQSLSSHQSFQIHTKVRLFPEKNKTGSGLYTADISASTSESGEAVAAEAKPSTSKLYITQMEAEGFRQLTFFPDRPDVMSVYTCRVEAPGSTDTGDFPVLLSNGNMVESGKIDSAGHSTTSTSASSSTATTRHYAVFHDPHPKPCYLFALVAGNLHYIERQFIPAASQSRFEIGSGDSDSANLIQLNLDPNNSNYDPPRPVTLRVFSETSKPKPHLTFAMDSLVKSMRFDEQVFGLSYDLSIFNIVAVSSFNMGAMENKSLNIFNDKLILASPDGNSCTDSDFEAIESVVAHEYFHNFTGNRVTCRDWFQLTLKEGLTVFREQWFASLGGSSHSSQSDIGGLYGPSARVDQVKLLRGHQFPEDAVENPLSHAIRPDSYEKIDNFYTATVYEKGAEVIRMLYTILGEGRFLRGMDDYFGGCDGKAVDCEAFLEAMERQLLQGVKADSMTSSASGASDDDLYTGNLDLFRKWYSTKGTPTVRVRKVVEEVEGPDNVSGNASGNDTTQSTAKRVKVKFIASQADSEFSAVTEVLHIPLRFAVLRADGSDNNNLVTEVIKPQVFHLTQREMVMCEVEVDTSAESDSKNTELDLIPSLNRGFGAPVKIEYNYSLEDLGALVAFDSDPFARYEASFKLMCLTADELYGKEIGGTSTVTVTGDTSSTSSSTLQVLRSSLRSVLESYRDRKPGFSAMVVAQTLEIPDFDTVLNTIRTSEQINPNLLSAALSGVRKGIVGGSSSSSESDSDSDSGLAPLLREIYEDCVTVTVTESSESSESSQSSTSESDSESESVSYDLTQTAIGTRRLKNAILALLNDPDLAHRQYKKSCCPENGNLTEKLGALKVLVGHLNYSHSANNTDAHSSASGALGDFHDFATKRQDSLLINKWFMVQARYLSNNASKSESESKGGIYNEFDHSDIHDSHDNSNSSSSESESISNLTHLTSSHSDSLPSHADFGGDVSLSNPNRWRSLVGALTQNPEMLHCTSSNCTGTESDESDSPLAKVSESGSITRSDETEYNIVCPGYRFVKDEILRLDSFGNGQVAARTAMRFGTYRSRLGGVWKGEIEHCLRDIASRDSISPELREVVEKILGS